MSGASRSGVMDCIIGIGGIAAARAFFEITSSANIEEGTPKNETVEDDTFGEEEDKVVDLLSPPRTIEVIEALERLRKAETLGDSQSGASTSDTDSTAGDPEEPTCVGTRQRQRSQSFYNAEDARRLGILVDVAREGEERNSPGESDSFADFDFSREGEDARTAAAPNLPLGVRVVSSVGRPMSPDAVVGILPPDFLPPENVLGDLPKDTD